MPRLVRSAALIALLLSSSAARAEEAPPEQQQPEDGLIEAGLFLGAFFFSGAHELYDPTLLRRELSTPSFDVGVRGSYFPIKYAGVELEGAFIPTGIPDEGSASVFSLRLHGVAQYPWIVSPFLVVGFGGLWMSSKPEALGNDTDSEFHYGIGGKYYVLPELAARIDLRHIISGAADLPNESTNTSHFELLLGAAWVFGRTPWVDPDPDKDGIRGLADKCPTEKGVAPDGCVVKDEDGDGVPDESDRCPGKAGSEPDGCMPKDTDDDGFIDRSDACPEVMGIEPDGCPDPDTDKDSVPAKRDLCPEVAGIEPDGCPDPDPDKDGIPADKDQCKEVAGIPPDGCPDTDSDGLSDPNDKCVDQPETKNGFEDTDGCPDELPKEVKKFTGAIRGINFKSNSAEILPTSFATLTAAAKVLLAYLDIKLEIQGHTDNTGTPETNIQLSGDRAEAVRAYLIAQGVAADRIVPKGYGQDVPVGDNATPAGRAQNRRIEFKLIEQ